MHSDHSDAKAFVCSFVRSFERSFDFSFVRLFVRSFAHWVAGLFFRLSIFLFHLLALDIDANIARHSRRKVVSHIKKHPR